VRGLTFLAAPREGTMERQTVAGQRGRGFVSQAPASEHVIRAKN
jgi:hypothetical protein